MNESRPRWQSIVEWIAAVALAAVWLVAGGWKLSDVTATQVRLTQLLVPQSWSLAAALLLGTVEIFAAVLLLAPAWRRWGAWLSAGLLSVFMVYIGYHYRALTGADCSCFPWLQRAVGPMFFVQDGALIALAAAAGRWAAPSRHLRRAAMSLATVAIIAGGLFALERRVDAGVVEPASVTVNGKALPLREGRIFLYFFNPACIHCFQAAQAMGALAWQATIIGLPTQDFEQGREFFLTAGVTGALLSPDAGQLRQSFPFQDVPYGVALDHGRVREKLVFFDEPQLSGTLRRIGFVR